MVGEVFAGISGFKAMFDLAKALKDANDAAIRISTATELQERIFAAQQEQAALLEVKTQLEKRVADLEAWDADKQRYQLNEFVPGQFSYVLKEEAQGGEPTHHLCTNCYSKNQKSIMHTEHLEPSGALCIFCPYHSANFTKLRAWLCFLGIT